MPTRWLASIATFLALSAAYGVYYATVVPWLRTDERRVHERDEAIPAVQLAATFDPMLQEIFPSGSWELSDVNLFRTQQFLLIWKSHQAEDSRRLKVYPLTIVFLNDSPSEGDAERRPARRLPDDLWSIRAPAGAILQFEDELHIATGRLGKFHSGFIPGTVTAIRSSLPGRAATGSGKTTETVELLSKNLQFDEQRIWTNDEFSFQWGSHFGTGRDLTVTLSTGGMDHAGIESLSDLAVESVRLVHLDRLHITTPSGHGADGRPVYVPWHITAQGPLLIHLQQGICQLSDRVYIERQNDQGHRQALHCDQLAIRFSQLASPIARNSSDKGIDAWQVPRFRLEELSATGNQIVVEATMEADGQTWSQRLEGTGLRYVFPAPEETGEPNMDQNPNRSSRAPGDALATGPGRVIVNNGGQPPRHAEVRFGQSLQWSSTNRGGYLTVLGAASCTLAGAGTLSADALQVAVHRASAAASDWSLEKLMAKGSVQVAANQIRLRTEELNADFLPAEQPANTELEGPLLINPRRNASSKFGLGTDGGPSVQLHGDRVHLQIVGQAPHLSLHSATILGKIRCQMDAPVEDAGQSPVTSVPVALPHSRESDVRAVASVPTSELRGEELRYLDLGNRNWRIDVKGQPAVVQTSDVELTGSDIHVDAAMNKAWMDGPGIVTMPFASPGLTTSASTTRNDKPPARAQLTWNQDMVFDGSELICRDGVTWRGPYQLSRGRFLRVRLERPIQLRDAQASRGELALATSALEGNVLCENRVVDEQGLVSVDTASVQSLQYDHRTSLIQGQGPGWVETVRRGDAPSLLPSMPAQSPSHESLRYLRVDFERGLYGDMDKREIRFLDQVRTIYGPVQDWSDRLIVRQRDQLTSETILLQCRELIAVQRQVPPPLPHTLELIALGDTVIDGLEFSATAERLSYDQAKDLLVMEGNERSMAQITYQARQGDRHSKEVARKLLFRPKTKELKVEGLQFLEFQTRAPSEGSKQDSATYSQPPPRRP